MTDDTDDTTARELAQKRPVSFEFLPSVRQGYQPSRQFQRSKSGKRLDQPLSGRSTVGVKLNLEGRRKDGSGWEDLAVRYDEADDSFSKLDRQQAAETLGKHLNDNEEWVDIPSKEIAEVNVDIRMFGPGDVAGIDHEQVTRVHPEEGTQRMPSNYFPHVEFMRPDLPWLFSPERADDSGRVRPWLTLAVVERSDATVRASGTAPLERLEVTQNQLPPQSELWAWAHTQVNHYPDDSQGDPPHYVSEQAAAKLFTTPNASAASRIICPRRLDEQTEYLAALIPTFEPGRRAGLGREPYPGDGTPTLGPAWDAASDERKTFPIYFSWEFTSGRDEDFEGLVRKLEPRDLSKETYSVGVRRVDVSDPGPIGLQDITADGLVEEMGGAMKAGDLTSVAEYPAAKKATLESILEHPEQYAQSTSRSVSNALARLVHSNNEFPLVTGSTPSGPNDVPIVSAPIYGRWHVMRDDVPDAGSRVSWVRELNLDPRYRLAAGFGTSVLRENQDEYMRRAWEQFGSLRAANRETKRREAGSAVNRNLGDRIRKSGLGTKLRDQIDYGGLVDGRSIEELNRRIAAAERFDDVGPDTPDPDDIGPREDGWKEWADVAGGSVSAGAAGRRDLTTRDPAGRYENVTSTAFRQLTQTGGSLDAKADASREETPKYTPMEGTATDEATVDTATGTGVTEDMATETVVNEPLEDSVTTLRDLESTTTDSDPTGSDELLGDGGGEEPSDGEQDGADDADTGGVDGDGPDETDGTVEMTKSVVPEQADWRVDDDGELMSLEEALEATDEDLKRLPKALLQLEGTKRHCVTARREIESVLSAVDDGREWAHIEQAVFGSPSLEEICGAIRENTFDAVDRQFSKLLTEPPEPLSDELDRQKKDELLDTIGNYHDQLMAAVREALAVLDSEQPDADALKLNLTEARRAIEGMEAAVDVLWGYVDTGTHLLHEPIPAADVDGDRPAPADADRSSADGPASEPMATEPMQLRGQRRSSAPAPDLARAMDAQFRSATSLPAMNPAIRRSAEQQRDRLTQMTLFSGTITPSGKRWPALLDGVGWTVEGAKKAVHPMIAERDKPLSRVMAAPAFDDPMYRKLKALDQEYLLPGVDDIPNNTIGAVVTNPPFIESFMCGLNHEMGAELLYRRYPTDRRRTHFRQFWDYSMDDGEESESDSDSESESETTPRYDIQEIHEWMNELGKNYPRRGSSAVGGEKVVLLVRGELLKMYPRTRIYAAKAIQRNPLKESFRGTENTDGLSLERAEEMAGGQENRIPLLEPIRQAMLDDIRRRADEGKQNPYVYTESELEDWGIRQPIFEGDIDPNVEFFGFDMGPDQAVGQPLDIGRPEFARDNLGWFFVFEERMGETRFGLDSASDGDGGAIPDGIVHGANEYEPITETSREYGWSGLSWGHLVDVDASASPEKTETKLDEKSYVRVTGDRPWNGEKRAWRVEPGRDEKLDETMAAEWGTNSAHMARITWQLPVRVAVHADDLLQQTGGKGGKKGKGGATPDGGRPIEELASPAEDATTEGDE